MHQYLEYPGNTQLTCVAYFSVEKIHDISPALFMHFV